jgi:Xaa-Pro aminopeptidase
VEKFIKALFCEVDSAAFDAAIITSPENRYYLSGFNSHMGYIFAARGNIYNLVDFRYYEAAAKNANVCEVILMDNLENTLQNLIRKHNIKGVLIEKELKVSQKERLEEIFSSLNVKSLCDGKLDSILQNMRAIKSYDEIERIKSSQKLTEDAFKHVLNNISAGMTEKQIALDLEFFMKRNGAKSVAFDLIVVSGENTSLPHGEPGDKKIQSGELLTMDIGANLDGYNSDMTRTVAVRSVSDKQRRVYEIVLQAQLEGIKSIKAGIKAGDADDAARSVIAKEGYGACFGHSTGHGVGLCIHENPRLAQGNQTVLESGMVITVEPGIYLKGEFGVRIEDMVLVTESGCENLTNITKDLLII